MIHCFADVFEGVIQSVGRFCDGIIEFAGNVCERWLLLVGNVCDESLILSVTSVSIIDSVGHVCEGAI